MSEPPAADPPKSLLDKFGAGLPVALTALSTIFAGMSTGELSRAMYWRSAAAQDQSKANDQWSLAGFKRDRSLICETTAATLRAQAGFRAPPVAVERTPEPEVVGRVRAWVGSTESAPVPPPTDDPSVRAVLQAVHHAAAEAEVLKLARQVDVAVLERAIREAAADARRVEGTWDGERRHARSEAETAAKAVNSRPTETVPRAELAASATAAQAVLFDADDRRYRAESVMNFWVGFLLEVRVKTSTATSDRHRQRSENFFFAMLTAQVGAVGSSLALARRRRSALWVLAAAAGLAAVGFGGYVYLTM
jgi:hypothetical protein